MVWMLISGLPGVLIPAGVAAAAWRGYALGPLAWIFPLFHLPFFIAGLIISTSITREARRRARAHPGGLCPCCEHPLPEGEDPVTCTECGLRLPRADHLRRWRGWLKD